MERADDNMTVCVDGKAKDAIAAVQSILEDSQ